MSDLRSIPFSMVPVEAAGDHRLNASHYRLLITILSFRKKNTDVASVSREYLAERSGYSVNSVSRITSQLQRLGWIEKEGGGGKGRWSDYRVTVPDALDETLANPERVLQQNTGQPEQETLSNPARGPLSNPARGIRTERNTESKTERGARKRATPRHPWPYGDDVPQQWTREADSRDPHIDWEHEARKFLSHHLAKGSKFSDWKQAWFTWVYKAIEFKKKDQRGSGESHQVSFGEFK